METAHSSKTSVCLYLIIQHRIPKGYFHSQRHDKSNKPSGLGCGVASTSSLLCVHCMHSGKENSAKLYTGSSSKVSLFTAYSVLILPPDVIHNVKGQKISKMNSETVILAH